MVQKQVNKTPTDMAKIAQKCELSKNANLFVTIVLRATTVWMGDAPMGRLYFVAPHSNNKNYKGQHRTTIFLLFCPLLSLVVLCCLIFSRELP